MTVTLAREELDELKASVDLVALMQSYGVELKVCGKGHHARCPFHDDDKPSLSVTGKLWQCFGCQEGGDVLSFLQLKEKVDFAGAVSLLRRWKGQPDPEERTQREQRYEVLERVAHLYHQAFWESSEAQQYLTARGLGDRDTWQAFRFGYCDGSLGQKFGQGALAEVLKSVGLLNEESKEHFRGCLVVPSLHPDRGVVGFYGRRLAGDKGRHFYLSGPRQGVLNWQALKTSRKLYLTEGVLDAASLWQAGVREVSCLHGLSGIPGDLKELLRRYKTREVVLCLDSDKAGKEALPRLLEQLENLGLAVSHWDLPEGKDPNQMLQELGSAGLSRWLSEQEKVPEPDAPQHENDPQGFVIEFGPVRYDVRMIPPFSSRLRIRLCGSKGDLEYLDKLDLYVQRARQQAGREIAKTLKLQRFEAEIISRVSASRPKSG
ncbi:MAG: toprim domain-containing protein [Candidatus Competibacteraceae bacterium]|nr:toprim domain-containing protein [Candidatus Competibacteraceae bacterium]